ncbi:MAG: macro domain-containing protein [Chloroflexota bacterium]
MKIVKGDLIKLALNGDFDVIIHGCNCFCSMRAGIAKAIKSEFTEAYKADLATEKGDKNKLGTYTSATVERDGHEITIVNAYTQFNYRGRGRKADYEAMKSVFEAVKRDFAGKRIGYPLIGAGLAGGDWEVISKIIEEALTGEDHTLIEFDPNA